MANLIPSIYIVNSYCLETTFSCAEIPSTYSTLPVDYSSHMKIRPDFHSEKGDACNENDSPNNIM